MRDQLPMTCLMPLSRSWGRAEPICSTAVSTLPGPRGTAGCRSGRPFLSLPDAASSAQYRRRARRRDPVAQCARADRAAAGRRSTPSSPIMAIRRLIEQLLAEALTLTALLGSLLKEPEGQLTLQAQTEGGIIDLLVCDYLGGELRGYVRHDPERLADASRKADAEGSVRQGLSRDHLRPAGRRRALPGDRAAGGQEPRRGGAKLFRPVGADPEPGPARRRASAMGIGSRAACCSSICPRARRDASGCTRGSTIPTGRMSRSSADR